MTIGIYSITSPSNKVYIGQSRNIKRRWWSYKKLQCKNQPAIYNSLLKYGVEAHIFKVEQEVDISKLNKEQGNDLLNQLEIFWEEKYKKEGYVLLNIRKCGGCFGSHAEETKEKISKAVAGENNYFYGKKLTKEQNGFYGRKHSEETKRKISQAKKGNVEVTKETREKISKALTGREVSEKTREKLSKINSGKNNPRYGVEVSEGTRRKMSEAHKGEKNYFYNNPQKGKAHGRYDSTLYYFYNKELDLHKASTKYDLRQQYGLKTTEVSGLVNGKRKQAQGWIFIQ